MLAAINVRAALRFGMSCARPSAQADGTGQRGADGAGWRHHRAADYNI